MKHSETLPHPEPSPTPSPTPTPPPTGFGIVDTSPTPSPTPTPTERGLFGSILSPSPSPTPTPSPTLSPSLSPFLHLHLLHRHLLQMHYSMHYVVRASLRIQHQTVLWEERQIHRIAMIPLLLSLHKLVPMFPVQRALSMTECAVDRNTCAEGYEPLPIQGSCGLIASHNTNAGHSPHDPFSISISIP